MANQQMDLAVGVSVVGEKATRDALNRIGRAVGDAGKEMEHGAKGAEGFKEVGNAVRDALGKIQGLAGPAASEIGELVSAFAHLGGGIGGAIAAVAAAGAAFAGLALHGAEAAAKVEEGAKRAGTSVENYQGLAFAFQQTGSSAEGMEKALSKISEAQGKALEAADKYDESAQKVQQANERMRESAENYSDALSRINSDAASNASERRRSTAEEILRVQQDSQKAASRNANRAGQIEQDAGDHIARIKRDAALADQREQRRIQRERERLSQDHYRKEMQELRKFHEEQEAEAEKAETLTDQYHKMGVALLDATGHARDTIEVYKDIAEKISKIENPADRAAKAIEVFGRRVGAGLTPNLEKGRTGIEAFFKEAQKLGTILTGPETEFGKKFKESFEKLEDAIGGTLTRIGLALAKAFKPLVDAASEAIGKAQPLFVGLATLISEVIGPKLNELAGVFTALGEAAGVVGNALMDALKDGPPQWLKDLISLSSSLALILDKVLIAGIAEFTTLFVLGLKTISGWIETVYEKLQKLAKLLGLARGEGGGGEAAIPPAGSGYDKYGNPDSATGGLPTGEGPGHAMGGFITGGRGGIDDVPARLTAGEYVVNKTAADRHRPMLDAINYGRGYALGGLVESIGRFVTPAPLAFAAGGSVPAGGDLVRVDLSHNGKIFPVRAGRQIVDALVDHAKGAQMSSGGVKPSWYGGRAGG